MCSCKTENTWITSIEYDLDVGAVITIHCITVLRKSESEVYNWNLLGSCDSILKKNVIEIIGQIKNVCSKDSIFSI